MIDDALIRPPRAEIQGVWWRETIGIDSIVAFYVQVKNLTSDTLLYSTNGAEIHAIAYEDAHINQTDHFGRGADSTFILDSLAPNSTSIFRTSINEAYLSDANWDNLHFITMVDYRPGGSIGPYDMLQAAYATPVESPFDVKPDSITFMVDPADLSIPTKLVHFIGPSFIDWTASNDTGWVNLSLASGTGITQPTVSINKGMLIDGWQQGILTFTTGDGRYTDDVPIGAYLGPVIRYYMPIVAR
jgi:hypothetical protein